MNRFSTLRQRFKPLSSEGHHLLSSLLMYDPDRRISASEALEHQYFKLVLLPVQPGIADEKGEPTAQTSGLVCFLPFTSCR